MDSTGPHGFDERSALEQADAARKAGDLNTAIPLYGRALQENPDSVQAKLGLGQSYLSLGAGGEAAAQFRDVLARHSDDTAAHRGLAAALISQGQPALAEKQIEVVLQADSRDYKALNVMGVSLDMQGRHVEAQTRYRQGLELQQDYAPLRSNLGLSLAISGQAPEAVALLAPLAGNDTKSRENLAFAYAIGGDFTNSLQLLRRDMNEPSAQRQLSYYMQLRSMPPDQRSVAVRANPSFFPQGRN